LKSRSNELVKHEGSFSEYEYFDFNRLSAVEDESLRPKAGMLAVL
jgi:hypothetical protein